MRLLNYLLVFYYASFELYNANNLNENEIVTTFKGVDKLIGELKVKIVN